MTEEEELPAPGCLMGLVLITTVALGLIVKGWVVLTMWQWFVVPAGPPPLHLSQALGLTFLVYLFQGSPVHDEERKKSAAQTLKLKGWGWLLFEMASDTLLFPIIILCIGWGLVTLGAT